MNRELTPQFDALSQYDWSRCLRGARISMTARAVAFDLMTYADADGSNVHPGIERLEADTHASESTIKRALAELTGEGWIRCVIRGGRGRKANEYRLTIPMAAMARLSDTRLSEYGLQRSPATRETDPWDEPW